ncbi:ADP-heptose:LPS heptosyltransferase [Arthrobacter sp. ov407]|uniref:glycosyltransferase family 9 protein n=1 Tax=Arthrobacter sp. ov407 TaxID=1761748 RepID=UPI00088C1A31|nr:glycosyltransferase family 9 protein [Arthrobacter sp. ov407]SDL83437.1 ADP-heptose:LPS heptosyltransferase [Arthrobacter sp. ov407]
MLGNDAAGLSVSGRDGRPLLLVLRALQLGDLLVAVPALHALRRAFPDHLLVYAAPAWLRDAVCLVGGYDLLPVPGLSEPLAVERGTVDIAVNLHGRGPESQLRIEAVGARQVISHASNNSDGPGWVEDIHERRRWTRLLQWHGIAADPDDVRLKPPPVRTQWPDATAVHAGAAFASRLWPESRFAEVAERLAQSGHRVVVTGSAAERARALAVAAQAGLPTEAVLAGRLSLGEFIALMADARLVVSGDTGAAHLAAAYRRPSVVLFGPARLERWGPPPGPHIVLTKAGLRRGDAFAGDPDPALLGVRAQEVLDAVRALGLL